MAASGEPYSVAARKLGSTGAADEAAAREVVTRVEATLAASSARFEVRKEVTADPVTAPVRDRRRHGPVKRLAGVAVKAAWDHMVPEPARTAASGMARGIIEPATRQFQHHQLRQDSGVFAMGMIISRAEFGGTPDADVIKEDPLELLMRLRSVTAARYAGEETIREARCRKIAVAVSGTTAVFTVWADGGHVRKIQAVTQETTERIGVTVLATATVTVQLWDFGVPVDSVDWPPLPRPLAAHCLYSSAGCGFIHPRSQARGFPGQVSDSWSKAARRPARICLIEGERFPSRGARRTSGSAPSGS
jgi:hypothetical protein